jgi:hypothetical protein
MSTQLCAWAQGGATSHEAPSAALRRERSDDGKRWADALHV